MWTWPCKNTISCILPPCRQQSTSFQSAPSLFILPSSVRQQPLVRAPTTSSISHPPFIHPSNLYSTTTQLLHNHFQDIQQPRSNHNTTILRVESKNDSDSTIHIRDSPATTATKQQFNLNHKKEGAANVLQCPWSFSLVNFALDLWVRHGESSNMAFFSVIIGVNEDKLNHHARSVRRISCFTRKPW